jgi:hypothetical protein
LLSRALLRGQSLLRHLAVLCRRTLLRGALLGHRPLLSWRAGYCRWALLRLTLAGRALLHPFSTSAVGEVSADLSVTGGQSLAKSGPRRSGCTRSCKCSKRLTAPTLLQPLTSFRREALASFAALEKLSCVRPCHILPATIETLPSVTGVAIDVAVPARRRCRRADLRG